MKFKKKDGNKFEFGGIKGVAITSKEDIESGNVAYIEVNGRHGKMKNTEEDRFYFVIQGTGKFIIDGEEFGAKKHDVIVVRKNTAYDYEGKMELVLFDTPAFDPSYDIMLE
ncbi:MAG: cupin domain-containing protein [Candidatus Aenigmarchaeota archaeon]|nr:cupin domain-containing protein [Candidatus Aenigmarchaeota archaeon]